MGVGKGAPGWLAAVAGRADVPVFPVVGAGGRPAAEELWLLRGVRVVDHPRAAAVLVVVGRLTRALLHPALIVHDQMPAPRATVWWPVGDGGAELIAALPDVVTARVGDGDGLRELFADLVAGRRPSGPPALPDMEAAKWRGVGPYGHGGTGMTGGVPFGRPLAGRAPDPDGMQLDQLPLSVGPLFPPLPPGLVLHVELQGDVVRQATLGDNPFRTWPGDPAPGPLDTEVFLEARSAPASVATLEVARARHHLRWLARVLRLHGLAARSLRALALARSLSPADHDAVAALARTLGRSRSLASATAGRGVVHRLGTGSPGGPVARAGGRATDARVEDRAYKGLGFEPVVHDSGDAWARLRQRAAEAVQALDLARRAGERIRHPGAALEGPRGRLAAGCPLPSSTLASLLPELLAGQEWGDAMTTVASLDLDMEEAAMAQAVPAQA
ncbi:MAG: hypothetical protein ACR2K0_06535 [Acidimicrobiales bacterium]